MRAVVKIVNADDGLVAVETERGDYSVFGLMGDEPLAVGDVVSGALDQTDQQTLTNETRGGSLLAYVEDVGLSLAEAQERLG